MLSTNYTECFLVFQFVTHEVWIQYFESSTAFLSKVTCGYFKTINNFKLQTIINHQNFKPQTINNPSEIQNKLSLLCVGFGNARSPIISLSSLEFFSLISTWNKKPSTTNFVGLSCTLSCIRNRHYGVRRLRAMFPLTSADNLTISIANPSLNSINRLRSLTFVELLLKSALPKLTTGSESCAVKENNRNHQRL